MAAPPCTLLQPPVFYPVLPYITTVFGGLSRGRMVCIEGTVPRSCKRFRVDFQCGSSVRPHADVPFRFTAIFGASSSALCAALWDGRWGPRLQGGPLALQDGRLFHFVFHFKEESVLVVANGSRLLEFRYRKPRQIVDTLKVTGHVSVRVIGFINEDPYHPLHIRYPLQAPFSLKDPTLDVPLRSRIESGLLPGHVITLRAQLHPDAQEFELALVEDDPGDIALRVRVDLQRGVMVRGSRSGPVWSFEEQERPPPSLHPGRYFEMLVLCGSGRFRLAVNGARVAEHIPPALRLARVRWLLVAGNLGLYWLDSRSPRDVV
ncbi:galectin-12-like isoform X2 [Mobula birostris]|uniref:galectin-12-like isoform X2 n=1 Tax=Mobula birostris TaxID=1983395 RepID=UPI003B28AF44